MSLLDERDVRIMVPRLRRALDPGVASGSAASNYTDDMLKDIAADAVAELILLAGDAFPYTLTVASADTSGIPTEYLMDPAPSLAIQSLVAAQAAIGQVWQELQGLRTKEKITNEGGSWEWEKSATFLKEKIRALFQMRDDALALAKQTNVIPALDTFTNILRIRNNAVNLDIEPYDAG